MSDLVYMSRAQWIAMQEIVESYRRIGADMSNEEAYAIWVQRGMPIKREPPEESKA